MNGSARRFALVAVAAVVGLVIGAIAMLSWQGAAMPLGSHGAAREAAAAAAEPARRVQPPQTVLAWTPGEMPAGFAADAAKLKTVDHVAVVNSGTAWLTGSRSADGAVVDDPPKHLAYPLEVAGVDPSSYRAFLPPADREIMANLSDGRIALGESSAKLRGLGPGAVLRFGHISLKVAAVLPDELVGAHEVLASYATARRLGVVRPRYALVDPAAGTKPRAAGRALLSLRPPGQPMQIRTPGETPYFRMGDAVLPPISEKEVFGEFAARPAPGGNLVVDKQWVHGYIVHKRVPILGAVTCNREIMPQLEGALREIKHDGLAHFLSPGDYGGCYSPRFINHDPNLGISHHAWGAAIDVNVSQNPFGHTPHQNRDVVKDFADWGFTWGGTWIVPDGMHFEYEGPPQNPR